MKLSVEHKAALKGCGCPDDVCTKIEAELAKCPAGKTAVNISTLFQLALDLISKNFVAVPADIAALFA